MPLVIYQVGDVPLFHTLAGVNNSGTSVDADREWEIQTLRLTGVSGDHVFNSPTRPIAVRPELNIKGTLLADTNSFITKTLHQLMSYGGVIGIPIIGFYYEDRAGLDLDHCGNCTDAIVWVVSYGMLTKVSRSSEYLLRDETFSLSIQAVDLSMSLNTRWEALNPYIWEYRINSPIYNTLDENISQELTNNLFVHPRTFAGIQSPTGYFFCWKNLISEYLPIAWGERYTNGRKGGQGSDFVDFGNFEVFSDPTMWSAAPVSVYAFTNLVGTGTITLKTRRPFGVFYNDFVENEAILDLSDLDSQLQQKGYGGLNFDDVIITGQTQPYPGFVLRNREILTGIRPAWAYDGLYPGETSTGYNYITVSGDDAVGKVAYIHNFGAY